MPKLLRLLLILLPLLALYAGLQVYAWTGRAALAEELDGAIGPWSSALMPWLEQLSPDLAQGLGAFYHARNQWQWSWPAALVYGFPGVLLAVPMMVAGISLIVWQMLSERLAKQAHRALPGKPDDAHGKPARDDLQQ